MPKKSAPNEICLTQNIQTQTTKSLEAAVNKIKKIIRKKSFEKLTPFTGIEPRFSCNRAETIVTDKLHILFCKSAKTASVPEVFMRVELKKMDSKYITILPITVSIINVHETVSDKKFEKQKICFHSFKRSFLQVLHFLLSASYHLFKSTWRH